MYGIYFSVPEDTVTTEEMFTAQINKVSHSVTDSTCNTFSIYISK